MKAFFTCFLFGIVLSVSAQNTFKVRAFAPYYSALSQLVQLNDGSFVSIGSIFLNPDPNARSVNFYILKTDNNGKVLASKAITGYGNSNEHSLFKTNDGGFVACGYMGNNEAVVIKFKADLTIQWQKAFFITKARVRIYKVLQTSDGGYLMTGEYLSSVLGGNSTGYLLKTDKDGNVLFSKNYSNSGVAFTNAAITTDGNYALLSETLTGDINEDSCFLVKVNTTGTVLWSRNVYSDKQNMELYQLQASSDGGLITTGESYPSSNLTGKDYMMMVKFANDGTLAWSKSMVTGNNTKNYAYTVTEDRDGGYLFAGNIDTYDLAGDYDSTYSYIVKTNAAGNLQWTKTLNGATGDDYTGINSLITTSDGGYAVAGEGYFLNTNDGNLEDGSFIYKYNSSFLSCNDTAGSAGIIQDYGASATINAIAADLNTTDSSLSVTLIDAGTIGNGCSSTFPVQLLSFKATLQNKTVAVQWTTANEINTSYFEVERSGDAASFAALQKVIAKGNSAGTQFYNTTDLQPLPGTSYYRLKEVDKDGSITYSSIVPVTVLNNGVVLISPNPVQNDIRVVMQNEANTKATFQVIDVRGSLLVTKHVSLATGRNEITIPASSLSKGVYILKVIENNMIQTMRFVKE